MAEKAREKQTLNPDLRKRIKERIAKTEKYPDTIFCPNRKCGNILTVTVVSDEIVLSCNLCGYLDQIPRKK